MLGSRRRLSLVVAAAFLGVFCLQLLVTHRRLESVQQLEEYAGADGAAAAQTQGRGAGRRGLGGGGGGGLPQQAAQQGRLPGSNQRSLAQSRLPNPAMIVFAYNRVGYLNQTLHSLAGLAGLHAYTVYVSQDGNDTGVAELVQGLAGSLFGGDPGPARGFVHWQHPRVPELGEKQPGSAWLAQHYRWGLERVFMERGHSHLIILEDDMLFSPDFLAYFEATAPLLDADPTLWCISSWNDNGFTRFHDWSPSRLFRTSYFPGLGWMLKRELWLELGPKWPKDQWDHWMRMEDVSRGRDCLAPELNRNKNIGEVGANMDKASFKQYLASMAWSTAERVDFGDLSYLLQPGYGSALQAQLAAAELLEMQLGGRIEIEENKTYVLLYTHEDYRRYASRMKLWPFPRGHHQHVASVPFRGARVLLADRRFCPLLPEEARIRPAPGMVDVAAERGQSCSAACAARGMLCRSPDFWFINSCTVLKRHFPCERGCMVELGHDVPNYVMGEESPGYRYCLLNQKAALCKAVNPHVARLCPCSPPLSPGEVEAPERWRPGMGMLPSRIAAAREVAAQAAAHAAGEQQREGGGKDPSQGGGGGGDGLALIQGLALERLERRAKGSGSGGAAAKT